MRRIPAHGIQLTPDVTIELAPQAAHYVRDVLRLGVGDAVEVFDGEGAAFVATIVEVAPLRVHLGQRLDGLANESPCAITLYQAIPKKDRFEWVLEKVTELGVARVVPIETARSVVRIPAARAAGRVERWTRIAEAAARQCGRSVTPRIDMPVALTDALAGPRHGAELVLSPTAAATAQDLLSPDVGDVGVWVGPEGGFSDDEVSAIEARATACRLGPRVLRSETAGVVAVVVVQSLTGGLE